MVAHFRPISLCNTIYKVLSKVVVGRLKKHMNQLISPFQTGFVPGRQIHKNIIIAREAMHSMERMKGKIRAFAIKVDLSKAYDKLSWECIWKTLSEIQIPEKILNVIIHFVASVETNVNWNGSRNNLFHPQRGIRQGDPISPYLLFVLCMDKMTHLIEEEIIKKRWKGVKLGKHGLMISHLMFADDLLTFGEASKAQLECVMETIACFCNMTGQEISQEKTSILFSKNVSRAMQIKLHQMSKSRKVTSFGKYLGVPLSGKKLRMNECNYIVNQVAAKLNTWKRNNLSLAGRLTLAKSVIEVIPL